MTLGIEDAFLVILTSAITSMITVGVMIKQLTKEGEFVKEDNKK
jgi:hypothetical protein